MALPAEARNRLQHKVYCTDMTCLWWEVHGRSDVMLSYWLHAARLAAHLHQFTCTSAYISSFGFLLCKSQGSYPSILENLSSLASILDIAPWVAGHIFKYIRFSQMVWLLGLLGTASQKQNLNLRKKRSDLFLCFKRNKLTSSALMLSKVKAPVSSMYVLSASVKSANCSSY